MADSLDGAVDAMLGKVNKDIHGGLDMNEAVKMNEAQLKELQISGDKSIADMERNLSKLEDLQFKAKMDESLRGYITVRLRGLYDEWSSQYKILMSYAQMVDFDADECGFILDDKASSRMQMKDICEGTTVFQAKYMELMVSKRGI